MTVKPLYIPPAKRFKGLKVLCYKCNRTVSEICKTTGKSIQSCPYGEKHIFKLVIHVPGTENERKTKQLETRDLNEAIKQAIEFEKEIKSNKKNAGTSTNTKQSREAETPNLLLHALARYIGWLSGEGVPAHLKRDRTTEYISDVERAFTVLVACLRKNGYDVSSIQIEDINDEMVGRIYEYLLQEKKFSNRTFNKYFGAYTSFLKWYSNEYTVVKNYFERAQRKKVNHNPEIINKEEYETLLAKITPENGIKDYGKGKKPIRNIYRPWLADGIRLGLETGRRREEIINLRFSDIVDDGEVAYIKAENYKVNRIQNLTNHEEKKFIFIPITASLRQLIDKLGYMEKQNSDDFILAPEIKNNRVKIMSDTLSRGFSHYYDQVGSKKLTFKSLRKSYITGLSLYMGENAKVITQHSGDEVLREHYIDKQVLTKAASGFEVFSKENNRKQEIEQSRTDSKLKQKEIER